MKEYAFTGQYLRDTVSRFPGKTAIIHGNNSVTFSELLRYSENLAIQLRSRGINTPAVINIPKSIEAIIAFTACQLAGIPYVPVDTFAPADRLNELISKLGQHCIIGYSDNCFSIDSNVVPVSRSHRIRETSLRIVPEELKKDDSRLLYIMFTSGTSGTPKGVAITQKSVINYIQWVITEYSIDAEEIIANGVPLYFDGSVLDIYLMFFKGCTLHLLTRRHLRFPGELIRYLQINMISLIFFTPSSLTILAKLDQLRNEPLPDMRKIFFIGEPMPVKTLQYFYNYLPDVLFVNHYGPVETTVASICWKAEGDIQSLEDVPIGRPIANTRILLVDNNQRLITRTEINGEIWIGGTGLAVGYWNDPEKTAEKFVSGPDAQSADSIFYKTGDIGYQSGDGLYHYIGRLDSQFKYLGQRIEPGDIENAVGKIKGVAQVCVVFNEKSQSIITYLSGKDIPEISEIKKILMSKLPTYMIPHRFIIKSSMPLNSNGKIDRLRMKQEQC